MKYVSFTDKDANIDFCYNFSDSSSYDNEFVISNHEDISPSLFLKELKFGNEDAYLHSGEFKGDYSSITGHFNNGYSSKGADFGGNTYLEVQQKNSSDALVGTFLFSCEKKTQGTDVIFSNYNKDTVNPSGFEFGINDANKLFFECNSSEGPSVFVLNNIPKAKNIFSVSIADDKSSVTLGLWDSYLQEFDKETFSLQGGYLKGSNNWIIGSGQYQGEVGINYSSEGYPFKGYIDKFVHFDSVIVEDDQIAVAKSFYENLTFTDETSGTFPVYVTGYTETLDQIVMGVTGHEMVITGYTEPEIREYRYITGYNVYGAVNPGETYYTLDHEVDTGGVKIGTATGIYEELTASTYMPNEIIGFETGYKYETYETSPAEPMYYWSGVEGELYRTYTHTPLYSTPQYYKTSDSFYDLDGSVPIVMSDGESGYGPKSYTYLGARNAAKDFVETQKGINMFSVNNFAGVSPKEGFKNPVVKWGHDLSFGTEAVSLLVNGVTKQQGDIEEYEDDNFEKFFRVTNGEFSVFEPINDQLFSDLELGYYDENLSLYIDDPVIDILQTGVGMQNQSLTITNTSQYGSPFSEINPTNRNIFLNGQKIYEGIDYDNNGGQFEPKGDILNITGVYHTTNDFNYDPDANVTSSHSGLGAYDINESTAFLEDSFVTYLNGIRLDPKAYVYHDSSVDLLQQGKDFIVENQSVQIYHNYDIDRLSFDPAGQGGISVTGNDFAIKGTLNEQGQVLDENYEVVYGAVPSEFDSSEITDIEYEDL